MPELNDQAVQVRRLIDRTVELMDRGDDAWRGVFGQACDLAESIVEPSSRDDASCRVAAINRHLCEIAGDLAGALRHNDLELAGIAAQRLRYPEPAEQARLDDHEWSSRLARSQILQTMQDLPGAGAQAQRSLELAATSLQPAHNRLYTLTTVAAIAMQAQEYSVALASYQELVEQYRRDAPTELGTALLGLAQAQACCGALEEATVTANRAEPLLAGVLTETANLLHLRALIAMLSQDVSSAQRHAAAHADFASQYASVLPAQHRQEAAKDSAFLVHASGDVFAARAGYEALIAEASTSDDRLAMATALIRGSNATQDCALAQGAKAGRADHLAALEQLDQARAIVDELDQPVLVAGVDYQYASFVSQFHPVVDAHSAPVLRAALERCQAAAIFLHQRSFTAVGAAGRQDFITQYALAAFELAFALAFRLGESRQVAELVELRCASATFGPPVSGSAPDSQTLTAELATAAAGPGGRRDLSAVPPPLLFFDTQHRVLAAAHERAERTYQIMPVGTPAPTW